jgi:ribosomal protein S27E
MCVPVLVANNVDNDARVFVKTEVQPHFTLPVLINLSKDGFYHLDKIPFKGKVFFAAGHQLISSCIRIGPPEPIWESAEIGINCPTCNMRYLYRVTTDGQNVKCKNCSSEIAIPYWHDIRIPALSLEEESLIKLECQNCKMECVYPLRAGQDTVTCFNCREELSVPSG